MQYKKYNYYNKLLSNYTLFMFVDYISNYNFIIFFDYTQLSSSNLCNLKKQIKNENSKSFILKRKDLNKLFSNDFKFLSSHIIWVFIPNVIKFLNIIKLLNNIMFFYSFNKCFSGILDTNITCKKFMTFNIFQILHKLLFQLNFNNILLILYYILSIVKICKIWKN